MVKKNKGTDLRQKEGEAWLALHVTHVTHLQKKEEVHNITLQVVYLILYNVMLYELSHSIVFLKDTNPRKRGIHSNYQLIIIKG